MAGKSLDTSRKRYNLRSSCEPASKRLRTSEVDDESAPNTRSNLQYLLNINDDCLFEIFKYLPLSDLYKLAEVCTRLKIVAQQFFSREYKCVANRNYELLAQLGGETKTTLIQARSLLSNFGEFIIRLNVSHDTLTCYQPSRNNFKMLQLISKYCTDLTELSLRGFAIRSRDIKIWEPLLANISSLTILRGEIYDVSSILSFCFKLKYLKLDHIGSPVKMRNLTSLETLKLNHCVLQENDLSNIIRLNQNLCKLSIIRCPLLDKIDFKEISNLKYLKEIELNQHLEPEDMHFEVAIQQLAKLKSLEKLSLNSYGCSVYTLISTLVNENVSIKNLHLANAPVDDLMIEAIAQLKTIKSLKLDHTYSLQNEHLIKLSKNLTSLEELDVFDAKVTSMNKILCNATQLTSLKIGSPNIQITNETYDQMLNIVKNRYNKSKLNITIYDCGQFSVSDVKLKENEETLYIYKMYPHFIQHLELDLDTGDELDCDTEDDDDSIDSEWDDYNSDDQDFV